MSDLMDTGNGVSLERSMKIDTLYAMLTVLFASLAQPLSFSLTRVRLRPHEHTISPQAHILKFKIIPLAVSNLYTLASSLARCIDRGILSYPSPPSHGYEPVSSCGR